MRGSWLLLLSLGLFACGKASVSSAPLGGAAAPKDVAAPEAPTPESVVRSESGARLSVCEALPKAKATWPRLLRLARLSCHSGDAGNCIRAGWSLKWGVDGLEDRKAALPFLECACARDPAEGCSPWATMFDHGHGVKQDHAAARRLYDVACRLNSGDGCSNLGVLVELGKGGAADLPRARELFKQACELGSASGCNGLGYLLESGRGGPVDRARALELYQYACDAGDPISCSNLGTAFERGEGRPKDLKRARELFELACKDRTAAGCANLAGMYMSGIGAPKDRAKGAMLYHRSCLAEEPWSLRHCSLLGAMVLLKESSLLTPDQAYAYVSAGCDDGDVAGCSALVVYWGERGAVEPAMRALRRACSLGSKEACDFFEQQAAP